VIDGFLRITTRPTGAEITINGEPRGSAPFEGRLPLGLYDVQIALNGYETQARTVDLTAAKPKSDLDLTLERSAPQATTALVDITSTPTGAAVSVDGVAVGTTPLRGVELTPGERHLELGKPGYTAVSRTVKVAAGRRVTVDVTLAGVVVVRTTPRPTPVAVEGGRVYAEREVDTPPQKLRGESPDASSLPHMKRGERISVAVTFVVDENGDVADLAISESQGGEHLNQAVIGAVRRWRFTPGVKGGVKVKVREVRKFTYEAG
jgi:TonB family protein